MKLHVHKLKHISLCNLINKGLSTNYTSWDMPPFKYAHTGRCKFVLHV